MPYDERHYAYEDTGCDLHDHCLTCPLTYCRYDTEIPERFRLADRERRDSFVRQRAREGVSYDLIAKEFGLTRTTVVRILGPQPQLVK